MPGDTSIEWTHIRLSDGRLFRGRSWNPTTGCKQISPGCDRCYALTTAERFRGTKGHPYEQGFDLRLWENRLELPLHWKEPCGIFVNSMSDWCFETIPDDFVARMFDTMLEANWHIYQLLTKRAPRMRRLIPLITERVKYHTGQTTWPAHLWFGVSVESMAQRGRITHLREVPAQVRFISYEPALGPLDGVNLEGISWLICGAESGHGARPMPEDWARIARDACLAQHVSYFLKQYAVNGKKVPLPALDGQVWTQFPEIEGAAG